MRRSPRLVVACLLPLLVACASRTRPEGAPRQLAAEVGLRFTVTLGSDEAAGYRWYLSSTPDPAVVRSVSSEYRKAPAQSGGEPGDEIWTFDAVGTGTATLAFEYRKPFNRDVPPAKYETFIVKVAPAANAAAGHVTESPTAY